MSRSLAGVWRAELEGFAGDITIPGTLDESGIGHEDAGADTCHPEQVPGGGARGTAPIATRLTRRYTFEGPVRLSRRLEEALPEPRLRQQLRPVRGHGPWQPAAGASVSCGQVKK